MASFTFLTSQVSPQVKLKEKIWARLDNCLCEIMLGSMWPLKSAPTLLVVIRSLRSRFIRIIGDHSQEFARFPDLPIGHLLNSCPRLTLWFLSSARIVTHPIQWSLHLNHLYTLRSNDFYIIPSGQINPSFRVLHFIESSSWSSVVWSTLVVRIVSNS